MFLWYWFIVKGLFHFPQIFSSCSNLKYIPSIFFQQIWHKEQKSFHLAFGWDRRSFTFRQVKFVSLLYVSSVGQCDVSVFSTPDVFRCLLQIYEMVWTRMKRFSLILRELQSSFLGCSHLETVPVSLPVWHPVSSLWQWAGTALLRQSRRKPRPPWRSLDRRMPSPAGARRLAGGPERWSAQPLESSSFCFCLSQQLTLSFIYVYLKEIVVQKHHKMEGGCIFSVH